jgi:N-methylhydantoinase B
MSVEARNSDRLTFEDPIGFEVFKNSLVGLADEMGLVTLRTSHSPVLNQAMDFSTALCAPDGSVLAQGNSMMIHLGTFPDAMSLLLRKSAGQFAPGDVFVFNDEDEVAQHLPDLYTMRPYFLDERLVGFGVCTAHHVDIGGRSPGGMDIESREIFQEGLQLPLVKLYHAGVLNQDVFEILMRNVREPELYAGDLESQLAALHLGETGMRRLVKQHTLSGFTRLANELLDYSERLARAEISEIPDGSYSFEDWLDDDGVSGEPVRIHVTVEVIEDTIVVDWSGTAPQVGSALNCHIANTRAISYGALQATFRGDVVSNSGFYRPVTVKAPPGTIVNATRPAARGVRGITIYRLIDAVLGALAQAIPDRVTAAADGGPALLLIAGSDASGGRFVRNVGPFISGWGAREGADGNQAVSPLGANFASVSVEDMESEGLVRIERWGLVPDTGGPGTWRGCLGVEVHMRFLSASTALQVRTQRRDIQPYGLSGGGPGARSSNVWEAPEGEIDLPVYCAVSLGRDEVFRHTHSGGGGFGDPLLRDPDLVLEDALDGKVSEEGALRDYGVVVDLRSATVDEVQTEAARRERRCKGR